MQSYQTLSGGGDSTGVVEVVGEGEEDVTLSLCSGAGNAFTVIVDAGISVGFPGSRVKYLMMQ